MFEMRLEMEIDTLPRSLNLRIECDISNERSLSLVNPAFYCFHYPIEVQSTLSSQVITLSGAGRSRRGVSDLDDVGIILARSCHRHKEASRIAFLLVFYSPDCTLDDCTGHTETTLVAGS